MKFIRSLWRDSAGLAWKVWCAVTYIRQLKKTIIRNQCKIDTQKMTRVTMYGKVSDLAWVINLTKDCQKQKRKRIIVVEFLFCSQQSEFTTGRRSARDDAVWWCPRYIAPTSRLLRTILGRGSEKGVCIRVWPGHCGYERLANCNKWLEGHHIGHEVFTDAEVLRNENTNCWISGTIACLRRNLFVESDSENQSEFVV